MARRKDRASRSLRFESLETRDLLATFYVANSGSDANLGTAEAPWQTLQKAANTVRAGDTVVVRPGNYVGFDLRIDGTAANRITFQAESGAAITQRNARTPDGINLEGADYVTIDGFTINGMPRAGIRSVTNQNVVIRNNRVDQNARWGIFTGFSYDVLIEGNIASRSQLEHGIYVSNSGDRPTIRNNTIWGNNANGIHMNGDANVGGDGIITGALVQGNVIYDNGRSGGSAINADGVQNSTFRNNLIYNTHASGISLYRIDGGGGSTGNLVVNNTVLVAADGRWALNIQNGSTGNTVRNNILYTDHFFRGSLDISADSLAGFSSDYNVVMNRFTTDGGNGIQTLSQWRSATGQDVHSLVATPSRLFVNPTGFDFHLSDGSPALDVGTAQFAPAVDFEGQSRPSGSGVDIGADERPVVVAGALAAHYRLNETGGTSAWDSSGNGNHGVYVNNPMLGQPGALAGDTATSFNGVNQYVALPSAPFGNYGSSASYAITFETWFNAPAGASGVILGQTGAGATPGAGGANGYVPAVHLGTDGKLRSSLFWHGDVNARLVSPGAATYNDGNWHHVAVTYGNGVESLYIDGALVGQQAAAEVPYAGSYSYFLGAGYTPFWAGGNGGWHFFRGKLDEATLHARALSPLEINQHFAAGNTLGPVAHYRLNETSGTTANDQSGSGNSATYVNNPTLGQPGAVGGSLDTAVALNGVNQYVALPSTPFDGYGSTSAYALTFETWFHAPPGASGVILGQTAAGATPGSAEPFGWVPGVHLGTDGKIRSSLFWHGDVNARLVSPGGAAYNDGNWHHVAVTYGGGVETLFIDGVAVGQLSAAEVPYAAAYSYYLGTGYTAWWAGGNGGWHYFGGKLDEARLYPRALSAAEISQRAADT